jgi:1-acyl-sn-glycerol-3-phosphate acyltransferase
MILTAFVALGCALLWGAIQVVKWALGIRTPYADAALCALYFALPLPRSEAFRRWWGWETYLRQWYFGFRRVAEAPENSHVRIYVVCPHGMFSVTTIVGFALTHHDVVVMASSLLFWIPLVRELVSLTGAVPAGRRTLREALDAGRDVVITPEGLRSVLHHGERHAGTRRILHGIPNECGPRTQFIQCALDSSNAARVELVPVYAPAEWDMYRVADAPRWLRTIFLKVPHLQYPWPTLAWGHWLLGFWPRAVPLTLHYGRPIPLAQCADAGDALFKLCEEFDALQLKNNT